MEILHSLVAKLIWVSKRAMSGIDPAILFVFTRVTKSTKEYKSKLRRLLKYLKHTINDKIIMGADILSQFFTWINAAYGVHPNLKIHTGGCM